MRFGKHVRRLMAFVSALALFAFSCAVPELEKYVGLSINKSVYGSLPLKIYIDTAGGASVTTKAYYTGCTVSTKGGKSTVTNETAEIKVRGNSAWAMPKLSYKLKFSNKTALIGDDHAKEWTLIANYDDQSLMRNKLAYAVSAALDAQPFTTATEQAELYLNGKYAGIYLICEQVEKGKNRVKIAGLSSDPENTGYLIELDLHVTDKNAKEIEGVDWFSLAKGAYAVKEPSPRDDGFTEKHFDYIKNFLGQCLDAVCTDSYEVVSQLLDIPTFVDAYIVHELFNCCDVGFSSFFMYKDACGKLSCGPVWDFDISAGNCNYNASSDPNLLWAAEQNIWYAELLEFPEFKAEIAQELSKYSTIISDVIRDEIYGVLPYFSAFDKNFRTWKIMGIYTWPNPDELVALRSWSEHIEYLQSWLDKSLTFMLKTYCG